MTTRRPFGAILAGGRNSRYGAPKALATVAGTRIIDRVVAAMRPVLPDLVLITNDPALGAATELPWRPDALPGLGALGGIHAALRWALEADRPGILAVACDMPFLSPALLRRILEMTLPVQSDGAALVAGPPDVVVPESGGRRGIEPLCAYYGTGCLRAIERAAARGDRRMIAFHDEVTVVTLPLAAVREIAPPEIVFLNVNTPEDRTRAESLARDLETDA